MSLMQETNTLHLRRLLSGDYRTGDLSALLLAFRRHKDLRYLCEVGDFIAHLEKRDRGISMASAVDTHAILQWSLASLGKPLNADILRPVAKRHLEATKDRLSDSFCFPRLKMSASRARKKLKNAIDSLVENDDATWRLTTRDEEEVAAAFAALQLMAIEPAFDSCDLINIKEFWRAAERDGLVTKAHKDRVIGLEPQLALYVIAVLNGSNVILPEGKIAPLRFSFRDNNGAVNAEFEIQLDDGKSQIISAPLFTTKLPSEDLYNPILAPKLVEGTRIRNGPADIPVELRPDGRLDIMSGLEDLLGEL